MEAQALASSLVFRSFNGCCIQDTHLNVGILFSNVSNTVTSPFNGAWFDSSSCLIADKLMLKSLEISVLPRTPFRSKMWATNRSVSSVFQKCSRYYGCLEKALPLRSPGHRSTRLWYNASSVSVSFSSAMLFAVSKIPATSFISSELVV